MFDMHCHILPGFDDGAVDLDTALLMMAYAHHHRTTAIVATPHLMEGGWLSWEAITAACARLQKAARDLRINLPLYPGAEVAVHPNLLKILTHPGPYCINGGRYLLVELPALEIPAYCEEFLQRLLSRGIVPVIAHPERNALLIRHPGIVLGWIRKGILMQINATSLLGSMGQQVVATTELLLKNRMVHLIGSDAHGVTYRRPDLEAAAARIGKLTGKTVAAQILYQNPELVISSAGMERFSFQ